ncbi:MAG TPA: PQQ-binding-like beta-propeller repeat protein [Planctomycetaceae bacterium]|nr:PQQ-binding-like beta-propeller repeat protein [Planctomycetaceae bacterium]
MDRVPPANDLPAPPPTANGDSTNASDVLPRRGDHPPPALVSGLIAICILVALAVRRFDIAQDNGTRNVVIAVMAFLALATLGLWHTLFSRFSRTARFAPPLVLFACAAAFFTYFRLDHVTGEMLPVFAPRFAPKADERLALPEAVLPRELVPVLVPRFSPRPDEQLDQAVPADGDPHAAPVDLRTTTPHDFPQFLGPDRSCAIENVALEPDWDAHPPRLVWSQPIGGGWSGFAVVNGFAVTQEQRGTDELVTCYQVASGRVMWFHARPARYESVMGGVGPRATPTIHDGRVYALGATGWLTCLGGATGGVVWEKHVPSEFGVSAAEELEILPFARSSSPLIVDDLVVVPAGGPRDGPRVSLVAYHRDTGEEVWRAGREQLSHASPALATLAGVRQILCINEDTVTGHDPATGRELWRFNWSGNNQVRSSNSQPVPLPPDRVFVSKGQGGGAKVVQLVPRGDGTFATHTLWHNRAVLRTKFTNVTILDGRAYGLSDGILECVHLETGQRVWKAGRYQHGQLLRVGRHLLVLSEDGEVALVEATPDSPHRVLGRFEALSGKTWNTLAFAAPFLLVRNAEQAACYELRCLGGLQPAD